MVPPPVMPRMPTRSDQSTKAARGQSADQRANGMNSTEDGATMKNLIVNRRSVLKGAAATGAFLAAPAVISSKALASSGELNLLTYAGFPLHKDVFDAFKADTGITVNEIGQPDSDSILAQAKLANPGELDLVEATITNLPVYPASGIVQPLDPAKLELTNTSKGMPGTVEGDSAYVGGKLYYMSALWGGEGMAYASDVEGHEFGSASLADLFDPKFEGQVTLRPYSGLAALGRVMEAEGKLPKPYLDAYKDEASMRAIYDVILAEAVKHKKNVAQFWTNDNEGIGAFATNGCRVGLVWESIGRSLADQGTNVRWVTPKEGAFGWNQGYVLTKGAKNVDQAYEYLRWISRPKNGVRWGVANQGLSSAAGSIDLLTGPFKDFSVKAYPPEAVAKMWWWPAQEPWFIKLRGEYSDRFRSA